MSYLGMTTGELEKTLADYGLGLGDMFLSLHEMVIEKIAEQAREIENLNANRQALIKVIEGQGEQ